MAPDGSAGSPREDAVPVLRPAAESDGAAIHAIYREIVLGTAISFEWEPPAIEEMVSRIRTTLARFPWLVAVSRGDAADVLGYASASTFKPRTAYDWSAEVTVYVAERARRRGVARRLYAGLHALLGRQNVLTTYAAIALPNPPSESLHREVGFEPIGVLPAAGYKFGRWHDVLWMRRELAPAVGDPGPFLPFPALEPGDVAADLAGDPAG